MSDFKVIFSHLHIEAANDQAYEPHQSPYPPSPSSPCPYWASCENPYCFQNGCIAASGGGAGGCPAHPNSTHTRTYQ